MLKFFINEILILFIFYFIHFDLNIYYALNYDYSKMERNDFNYKVMILHYFYDNQFYRHLVFNFDLQMNYSNMQVFIQTVIFIEVHNQFPNKK